jgi:hypothetical protein
MLVQKLLKPHEKNRKKLQHKNVIIVPIKNHVGKKNQKTYYLTLTLTLKTYCEKIV